MTEESHIPSDSGEEAVLETEPIENPEEQGGPSAREEAFLLERMETGEDKEEGTRSVGSRSPSGAAARADLLSQYRRRQGQQLTSPPEEEEEEGTRSRSPGRVNFAHSNRWASIGPMVVKEGQAGTKPATSGRTPGIAIAPGGKRIYVATANGGVWRSEDEGITWQSLMDAFDLNPTANQSDSLACGAVALVPGDWAGQDVIYVGSGEGAGKAYYGVGPIISTDGGLNWVAEPSQPRLVGSSFFALAVDPALSTRVVAATHLGLYRREADADGNFSWQRKRSGSFTSVVVANDGSETTFYAANPSNGIWISKDGAQWNRCGSGFPTRNVGRIGLAVQVHNPTVVYAMAADKKGNVHGLYRLDVADGEWRTVENIPDTLYNPSYPKGRGQGKYDLAIAVAPDDVNRIYLGGSTIRSDGIRAGTRMSGDWSACLYRCELDETPGTNGWKATPVYMGGSVHPDIHALVFAPNDANKLWVGCDGGVFYTTAAAANPKASAHRDGLFEPRNAGLSTLTMNHLAHHPTEEAVLFCGTQDNGGLRYTGEEVWSYSSGGDCGYFVVNWNNPYKILSTYVRGQIRLSADGGGRYSYSRKVNVPLEQGEEVLFYAPLVGTPYAPEHPETAERVAFGSNRVWVSESFGGLGLFGIVDWNSIPSGNLSTDRLSGGRIKSLLFASADKLYAGTIGGTVHRFDKNGDTWTKVDLPTFQAKGIVTDIEVDLSDPSGNSIYITLGGKAGPNRVWHFDGQRWESRSGPGGNPIFSLLDVQHNAIVMDRFSPDHLYVGADIGIWRSTNAGKSWEPFSRGLPDSAVLDLKQHPTTGMLRAATHGRGVFEFPLYTLQRKVELFTRDHQLDRGRPRHNASPNIPHPARHGETVRHGDSPDIKVDIPDSKGRYRFGGKIIDFCKFVIEMEDAPAPVSVMTHATANLKSHVYVQVHSHGNATANNLRVMLLLAKTGGELPKLPPGYENDVRNGIPVENGEWQTVGIQEMHGVRADRPCIAVFELESDLLPTPDALASNDEYCLVALVHSNDDPFTSLLSTTISHARDRKVACKYVKVVPHKGELPRGTAPRAGTGRAIQQMNTHTIVEGDTLLKLAKHYYGSGRAWTAIYRANRELIGDDPKTLEIGAVLQIPGMPEE